MPNDLYSVERHPYLSELMYFASQPKVAGMMTQDQRVTLNPLLMGDARNHVVKNELARLLLQDYFPKSELTTNQKVYFGGTPYQNDSQNAMRSILARGVSGDPSSQMDFAQDHELRSLRAPGGKLFGL